MNGGRAGWLAAGFMLGMVPRLCEAHLVSTRFGDFYGGAIHVGTTPEHVLALIALGLLSGLQERKVGRWILLAAPLGLFCGAGLAVFMPLGNPAALSMASLVLLGLLVALAWRLPVFLLGMLGMLTGLLHGYGNGLAIVGEVVPHLFALGATAVGLAAIALITATVASVVEKSRWIVVAARVGGSWIASIGIMMVGLALS